MTMLIFYVGVLLGSFAIQSQILGQEIDPDRPLRERNLPFRDSEEALSDALQSDFLHRRRRSSCPIPFEELAHNANFRCKWNHQGRECTKACTGGAEMPGNKRRQKMYCDARENEWKPDIPRCEHKDRRNGYHVGSRNSFIRHNVGRYFQGCSNFHVVGLGKSVCMANRGVCDITCYDGHQGDIMWKPALAVNVICQPDGTWKPPLPHCVKPVFFDLQNDYHEVGGSRNSFIRHNDGKNHLGLPECRLRVVRHGRYRCSTIHQDRPFASCEITCKEVVGPVWKPGRVVTCTCQPDGSWIPPLPHCVRPGRAGRKIRH